MTDAERDLALALLHDVRGNDRDGYQIVGLWCGPDPFPTRAAAEARYLDWLRRTYGTALTPEPPR